MALRDLLYLCPFCGHDPLVEEKAVLRCPVCARTYEEVVGEPEIRVESASGEDVLIPPDELARRVEEGSGGKRRIAEKDGTFASRAAARVATEEAPIRRGGEVVGFFERRGAKRPGTLRLEAEGVRFDFDGEGEMAWSFLDIRALQGSSSSIQISPIQGGVVTFRFEDESPRRWEELLKASLRRAWSDAGRGEIVEFQPRIRAASRP